jgi:hydroxypyruvate isomerase
MLKWSASLTMLFKDVPFVERFHAASRAGFGAVEFMWPINVNLEELVNAQKESGVQVALFNVDSGDVPSGERGFANDPSKRDWWRSRAALAIQLAERLGCYRINVQAGNTVNNLSYSTMIDCLCENIAWAIEQSQEITFFLEPLNRFENPRYILERTGEVVEVINQLGSSRIKLMLDIYHTQNTEGNLTRLIQSNFSNIGHIQIADVPARNQPGTGEINWRYLFSLLETLNYNGYIGLEYIPLPETLESLGWIPANKRLSCTTSDLVL